MWIGKYRGYKASAGPSKMERERESKPESPSWPRRLLTKRQRRWRLLYSEVRPYRSAHMRSLPQAGIRVKWASCHVWLAGHPINWEIPTSSSTNMAISYKLHVAVMYHGHVPQVWGDMKHPKYLCHSIVDLSLSLSQTGQGICPSSKNWSNT